MSQRLITFVSLLCFGLLALGAGCVQFGGGGVVGPRGMYRSLDRGDSWQGINTVLTPKGAKSLAGVDVYKIFTDPGDPDALYLASRGQGLFYSYNSGETWEQAVPLSGRFIYALTVDPQNKCNIFVSDGGHIFKTTDCARTWQLLYTEGRPNERVVALAIDFAHSNVVYAATIGGDILGSADAGSSWQVIKRFGFTVQVMVSDPTAANRLYVAGQKNGLYRSDDGGTSWVDLNSGLNGFTGSNNFFRLVLHPTKQNTLWWISKYGILRSTDAGTTWNDYKLITPPGGVNIYGFGVNPNNEKELYYVGTVMNVKNDIASELSLFGSKSGPLRSTFYKSTDGGKSWVTKKLPSTAIPVMLYVHPTNPNVLFLGFTTVE